MNSEFIEKLILRLCEQPRTFEFVSAQLSGFDPVELREILDGLESNQELADFNGFWCAKKSRTNQVYKTIDDAKAGFFNEYIGFFGLFNKPHPLDFEWRNSTGTLEYLITSFQQFSELGDKILLLGFPTLFAAACIKDIPQKVTLVEKNSPVVRDLTALIADKERFQVINADIFNVAPQMVGKHHCVIMDPPWYSPHFYQFMWLAAQCVEVGGIVAISLPPINTRPDIGKERVNWFSFCQNQGLCLENLYAQKLHYAMPFFEFNAFRAAGVEDVLPFWRKGDLALFRKVEEVSSDRPFFDEQNTEWIEREVDTVRIRVKVGKSVADCGVIDIAHIVKGDILPSISARDSRRKFANVWTSGNRIFNVNSPEKFVQLLDGLQGNKPITSEGSIVSEFISTLTEFEKNEYNNYLDWLYHEMERQTG